MPVRSSCSFPPSLVDSSGDATKWGEQINELWWPLWQRRKSRWCGSPPICAPSSICFLRMLRCQNHQNPKSHAPVATMEGTICAKRPDKKLNVPRRFPSHGRAEQSRAEKETSGWAKPGLGSRWPGPLTTLLLILSIVTEPGCGMLLPFSEYRRANESVRAVAFLVVLFANGPSPVQIQPGSFPVLTSCKSQTARATIGNSAICLVLLSIITSNVSSVCNEHRAAQYHQPHTQMPAERCGPCMSCPR